MIDCTMTIENAPFPDMPPRTVSSTIRSGLALQLQANVVYDKIALLATRGFMNIYHNAEWIMNFIHFAVASDKLPLVSFFVRFHAV